MKDILRKWIRDRGIKEARLIIMEKDGLDQLILNIKKEGGRKILEEYRRGCVNAIT